MSDASVFEALHQIISDKGLGREKLVEVLQQALLAAYKKRYGGNNVNVEAVFDKDSEIVKLMVKKYVVKYVENEQSQIALEDALKIKPDAEIGDEIPIQESLTSFGRIAIQTAKQVVVQRVKELERDMIYQEYKGKEGELINGFFQRVARNTIFVDLGKTDGILPFNERMPGERFRQGDRIKALILSVQNSNRGPQVILSRNHVNFVKKLFELEIPEIYDGIVEVINIVREPGFRTKVAVSSARDDIDPVGACVGMKGMRIQAIVREINNEKIDIVEFNENPAIYIMRAMQPAKLKEVLLMDKRNAMAVVNDDQRALALGRSGSNVKLASELTGFHINVKNEEDYQKYLLEKKEESKKRADEIFGSSEEDVDTVKTLQPESGDIFPEEGVADETDDMDGDEEGTPLNQLEGLTDRLIETFKASGITTVEDLLELTIEDLTALDGIGIKTAEQIQTILAENIELEEV